MYSKKKRRTKAQESVVSTVTGGDSCAVCGKYHAYAGNDWHYSGARTFLCSNDVCWRERVKKEEAVS